MNATADLTLVGDLDHLKLAWQATESILEVVPFEEDPEQTRYNLLLALQEALTNVLRHGYGGIPAGECYVRLRIEVDDQAFRLEIRDRAAPFDPTAVPDGPIEEEDGLLPEGGYGIRIIRAVTDRFEYLRLQGENVLILEKSLCASFLRR